MRYMMLIYMPESAESATSTADREAMYAEYGTFAQEAMEKGMIKGGDELKPSSVATTVRVRAGEVLKTDGPFAETKEQLGGYFLMDCSDLDEAIEMAAKIPGARHGSIEIRPIATRD
jgi:hypothetical protein